MGTLEEHTAPSAVLAFPKVAMPYQLVSPPAEIFELKRLA